MSVLDGDIHEIPESRHIVPAKNDVFLQALLPFRSFAHQVNRDIRQGKLFLVAAAIRNHEARRHDEPDEFGIAHARAELDVRVVV